MSQIATLRALLEQTTWWGNSLQVWVVSACILALGVMLGRFVRAALKRWGTQLANFTETDLDDAMVASATPVSARLVILGSFALVLQILAMPGSIRGLLRDGVMIAAGLVLIGLIAAWSDALFEHGVRAWRDRSQPDLDDAVIEVGRKLLKVILVIAGVLAVLQAVGLNVMSLLTGLGLGGLAVALAAQETLGNVLGSAQILTDRPFSAGDFVRVEGLFGRVTDIGLRSTKLLTPSGIRVIVPNKKIAEAAIENCSVHEGVTETFELGLTYDTSAADLQRAVDLVTEIVRRQEHTHERVSVHFASFGAFSLNLRVIYQHMALDRVFETRHAVNMAIKAAFDEAGLSFAFPTQTLHLLGAEPGEPVMLLDAVRREAGSRS